MAEESQAITEELNERLSAIRAGTFTDIEEIKSDWRADSTETQTIEYLYLYFTPSLIGFLIALH